MPTQDQKRFGLIFLAVGLTLFSLIMKFMIADHGLPSHFTNDTQAFYNALGMWEDYNAQDPQGQERFHKSWYEPAQPHKYPLALRQFYFWVWNLAGLETQGPKVLEQFSLFALNSRYLHISLFGLLLVATWLAPLPLALRAGAIAMGALSLVNHQFATLLRIHAPLAPFVLLSVICAIHITRSRFWGLWLLAGSLSSTYAMSIFFTGLFAFVPLVLSLFLRIYHKESSWPPILGAGGVAFVISLFLFAQYHPTIFLFLKGEGPLFNTEMGGYTGNKGSSWGLKGFAAYLNDIFGMDPLLYLGYVAGLVFLWHNKTWKQSQWLLMLVTILPYQIVLGCTTTNAVRRSTVMIGLAALIAAYGWKCCLDLKPRLVKPLIIILAAFNFVALIRYNTLADKDTRNAARSFVRKYLPQNTRFLSDHLGPMYNRHLYGEAQKFYEVIDYRFLPETLKSLYQNNPQFQKFCQKEKISPDQLDDPNIFPKMMAVLDLQYYVRNHSWQSRSSCLDSGPIAQTGELIAKWEPIAQTSFSASEPSAWTWPNDSDFLLWKIWKPERVGPTVEIFQMPWAKTKFRPLLVP